MTKNTDLNREQFDLVVMKIKALAGFAEDLIGELSAATRHPPHTDVSNAMDLLNQSIEMLLDAAGDLSA